MLNVHFILLGRLTECNREAGLWLQNILGFDDCAKINCIEKVELREEKVQGEKFQQY